jgi:hypothetical protein
MDWHLLVSRDRLDHVQRSRDDQPRRSASARRSTPPPPIDRPGRLRQSRQQRPGRGVLESGAGGPVSLVTRTCRPRATAARGRVARPAGPRDPGGGRRGRAFRPRRGWRLYRKAARHLDAVRPPMAQPQPGGHKSASFAWMPGTSLVISTTARPACGARPTPAGRGAGSGRTEHRDPDRKPESCARASRTDSMCRPPTACTASTTPTPARRSFWRHRQRARALSNPARWHSNRAAGSWSRPRRRTSAAPVGPGGHHLARHGRRPLPRAFGYATGLAWLPTARSTSR